MAFDLASAKPVGDSAPEKPKFDLASARPVDTSAPAKASEEEAFDPFSAGEPILQMGSAMIAKPVSDVAGIARLGMEGLRRAGVPGIEERDPQKVKEDVQKALTYEPKTRAGSSPHNPLNFIPGAIGGAIGMGGDIVSNIIKGKYYDEKGQPHKMWGASAAPVLEPLASGGKEAFEQAFQLGGAKGGAKAIAERPARQAALDLKRAESAPLDAVRDASQKAGITTPPEGFTFSGIAGKRRVENWLSAKNQPVFQKMVKEELGLGKGVALSDEELDSFISQKGKAYEDVIQAGYGKEVTETPPPITRQSSILGPSGKPIETQIQPKPVTRIPGMKTTEAFKGKIQGMIDELEPQYRESPKTFGSLKKSIDILKEQLGRKEQNPRFTMAKIKQLRKDASSEFKSRDDPAKLQSAVTKRAIADAYEQVIEEHLQTTGQSQLLADFRDARKKIAQAYDVKAALDPAGNIDARKLYVLSEKRPLSGKLKTISDYAGSFPEGARKIEPGKREGLTFWDFAWGAGALAAGHPGAAVAELGARLGIPFATERGWLQKRTPSYQAGTTPEWALPALGMGASAAAMAPQVGPRPQQQ